MKTLARKVLFYGLRPFVRLNAYSRPQSVGYSHSATLFGHCLAFVVYDEQSIAHGDVVFDW